jgi:hypothetical protein
VFPYNMQWLVILIYLIENSLTGMVYKNDGTIPLANATSMAPIFLKNDNVNKM